MVPGVTLRLLAAACLGALLVPTPADACATVDHGSALGTGITAERAIIVFDPATRAQHFIRSADFHTTGSSDFGFIVPTPAPPVFGEVERSVFDKLARAYEAARPVERPLELTSSLFMTLSRSADDGPARSVGVVEVSRAAVAGMDVVVVKADDAHALEEWLSSHGFAKRPALTAWLEHYVKKGFVFSAFRYSAAGSQLTSAAVRISFNTDTPVYPYREPSDALGRGGGLDVWLISTERREWVDEGAAGDPPSVMAATTKLDIPASLTSLLTGGTPWVTLFRDQRTKRPDGDVRFEVAKETSEQLPPPRLDPVPVPVEGLLCLVVVLAFLVAFVARRRRTATP
jgi:hypothetical protein